MVLDRILLWLFSFACVAGTCGIILVAPSLYDTRMPLDILVSKISKRKLLPAPVELIQRSFLQWARVIFRLCACCYMKYALMLTWYEINVSHTFVLSVPEITISKIFFSINCVFSLREIFWAHLINSQSALTAGA